MTVETILQSKGNSIVDVKEDDSLATVLETLRAHRIGAVLVLGPAREIRGVLSERDIVRGLAAEGAALLNCTAADLMTRDVFTCRPTDSIAGVMGQMTERRIRHLPVLDDAGRLLGMISIGDVVKQRIAEAEQEAQALKDYIATG